MHTFTSDPENQSIIDNIMLPFLKNFEDIDIFIQAFSPDGTIIYFNNLVYKPNFYPESILNKKLINIRLDDNHNSIIQEIEGIRKDTIRTKRIIQYLYITDHLNMQNNNTFPVFIAHHVPFFNSKNEVIATYSIAFPITPINMEYIFFKNLDNITPPNSNLQLTPRQHEILFLLCYNINQNKIADYLGITRGGVSKIICEQLMHKFDNVWNVDELVVRAIQAGINFKLPKLFIKPRIFRIEHNLD